MSRRITASAAIIFLCVIWPAAADEFRYPESMQPGGSLEIINGVPVLKLSGSAEEIGKQHALLATNPAEAAYEFPRKFLKNFGVGRTGWFLVKTASYGVLKNGSQRMQDEFNALMKNTTVERDSLAVGNAFLEIRRLGGCSALIVEDDRTSTDGPLFGRNFDFPPMDILQKYSLVTAYRLKDRHSFVSIGFPGLVGVISGINDKGLAVATLDVYQSKDGSVKFNAKGVPLTWTYRRILEECETVDEAFQLLKKTERTTWMNLAVSDKQHAAVFEITPDNVTRRDPRDCIVSCTNHFRTPELSVYKGGRRFKALEESRDLPTIGLKEMSQRLHATHQGEFTIQTMIFEPKAGRFHLAIGEGPTTNKKLATLDVAKLLKAN